MRTIEAIVAENMQRPSDINEHLPMLYSLAATCSRVTEFGIRGGVSTSVFMLAMLNRKRLGLGAQFTCCDINQACINVFDSLLQAVPIRFNHWCIIDNTVTMRPIEETDMLFIDTLHDGGQVYQELMRHAPRVRRYLVFHDTHTFGGSGETPGQPGLWSGIHKAISDLSAGWVQIYSVTNNNGLTIYERTGHGL